MRKEKRNKGILTSISFASKCYSPRLLFPEEPLEFSLKVRGTDTLGTMVGSGEEACNKREKVKHEAFVQTKQIISLSMLRMLI